MYWCDLYGYVADLLEQDNAIRRATFLVNYDLLCRQPAAVIEGLLSHCDLSPDPIDLRAEAAITIRPVPSSQSRFNEAQLTYIDAITAPVKHRLQQFYFL